MKIICIRKNICSHGKKNLLFLPSNMAAVQNLYSQEICSVCSLCSGLLRGGGGGVGSENGKTGRKTVKYHIKHIEIYQTNKKRKPLGLEKLQYRRLR